MMKHAGKWALITAFCICGSLTACQNSQSSDVDVQFDAKDTRSDGVKVANVSGTFIYQSDVRRAAIAQGLIPAETEIKPTDPVFKTVLEELIDQRLLALDAKAKSIDKQPEIRRRLKTSQERLLGNIRIEEHLKSEVNEDAIWRMYEAQIKLSQRGQERRARHILTAEKAEAQAVYEALEKGQNFTDLAKEKSIDNGTATTGGDLGYFSRDMLNTDFTNAVFKADIGDRIPPFKTEYGWHITEVLDSRLPPKPSFEDMRPEIVNFMTFDAIQSLLTDLREKNEVTLLTPPVEPAIEINSDKEKATSDE